MLATFATQNHTKLVGSQTPQKRPLQPPALPAARVNTNTPPRRAPPMVAKILPRNPPRRHTRRPRAQISLIVAPRALIGTPHTALAVRRTVLTHPYSAPTPSDFHPKVRRKPHVYSVGLLLKCAKTFQFCFRRCFNFAQSRFGLTVNFVKVRRISVLGIRRTFGFPFV